MTMVGPAIVTTTDQHVEAAKGIAGHLVQAGFSDQTAGTVIPQATADAVLARIEGETPKVVKPIGKFTGWIGREVEDLTREITGAERNYLAKPGSGIHLVPIGRTVQASKTGVFNTIINSFFRLMRKKDG